MIKLGDFEVVVKGENAESTYVSTPLTQAPEVIEANCAGTPLTMAPEVLDALENDLDVELDYDYKSDIWSFGCVYYKMLFGKYPFIGSSLAEILKEIKKKADGKMKYPKKISSASKDFLNRIFITEPRKRMKWSELFKHKIIKPGFDSSKKIKTVTSTSETLKEKNNDDELF